MFQEGAGRKDAESEASGGSEIPYIVGDDDLGPARDRDLDDHVIVRVGQKWAPEKEDLLLDGNGADLVDHALSLE